MKRFWLCAVPWFVVFCLVCYEGWRVVHGWRLARTRDITAQVEHELAPDMKGAIEKAELLGDNGAYRVVRYKRADDRSELLEVRIHNKRSVWLFADGLTSGELLVQVYNDTGFKHPLIECGSTKQGFPGYFIVHPQTGPDAHRFALGDYDLNGVFERKIKE